MPGVEGHVPVSDRAPKCLGASLKPLRGSSDTFGQSLHGRGVQGGGNVRVGHRGGSVIGASAAQCRNHLLA